MKTTLKRWTKVDVAFYSYMVGALVALLLNGCGPMSPSQGFDPLAAMMVLDLAGRIGQPVQQQSTMSFTHCTPDGFGGISCSTF